MCNDRKSLLYTAGGLSGAVSSLAGPGQSAGGGPGGEASEALKNLHFTVPEKCQKHLCGAFFKVFWIQL